MKLITYSEIEQLNISPDECFDWVNTVIKNKQDAILPPKISMKPFDGVFCNVMPSVVNNNGMQYEGVKVVTRYPERVPSLDSKILLMNAQNGEFLALMDGNWITAMRTGAVAAHSVMLFAKKGYRTIGMMGLGNVSRAALLVLTTKEKNRDFDIKLLRYKGQEESFIERFKEYKNLHFTCVDTYTQLICDSDVVISGVTYAPSDFCNDDAFPEGILLVPIHTLGFTNCDLFFDKLFGDDYGHVCGFKNFNRFKSFAEVTDVINGVKPGRENDKERIIAYNVGISAHDIYFASQIYEKLKENSKIRDIDVLGPNEKFWV